MARVIECDWLAIRIDAAMQHWHRGHDVDDARNDAIVVCFRCVVRVVVRLLFGHTRSMEFRRKKNPDEHVYV